MQWTRTWSLVPGSSLFRTAEPRELSVASGGSTGCKRLRELTGQPDQLTLVFDAGASSRQNLEGLERYVTAVRPSDHRALLSEAAGNLAELPLSTGATVRAWRTQRTIAGKQREVVVVFSPQLHGGQLRGCGKPYRGVGVSWKKCNCIRPRAWRRPSER